MKELSIEQKAKAYDKALEKARQLCAYPTSKPFISDLQDLFPELKESEDEKIRKELITHCRNTRCVTEEGAERIVKWISWLEKQGEHANFCNKIQIGDKVTRNKDGVLVNLSQLNRVAKKQGEQKPVDTAKQEMSDEEYCSLCMDINCDGCHYVDKSKHKEQKPVEWSEEDETVRNDIIAKLAILKSRAVDGGAEKEICEMEINWLKSLRPQSTWKPSDGQMDAIKDAIDYLGCNTKKVREYLMSLHEQLKKLRGE